MSEKPSEIQSVNPEKKDEVKAEVKDDGEKIVTYKRPRKYNKKPTKVESVKVEPVVVTKKRTNVLKEKSSDDDDDAITDVSSSDSDDDKAKTKSKNKTKKSSEKSHKQTFVSKLYDTILDYVVQLSVPLVIFAVGSIYEMTKSKQTDIKKKEDQDMEMNTMNTFIQPEEIWRS